MGLGQLYISLETSVLCDDWIYRGKITNYLELPFFAERTGSASRGFSGQACLG